MNRSVTESRRLRKIDAATDRLRRIVAWIDWLQENQCIWTDRLKKIDVWIDRGYREINAWTDPYKNRCMDQLAMKKSTHMNRSVTENRRINRSVTEKSTHEPIGYRELTYEPIVYKKINAWIDSLQNLDALFEWLQENRRMDRSVFRKSTREPIKDTKVRHIGHSGTGNQRKNWSAH